MGSYIFDDLNKDFLFNSIQFFGDATISLDPSTPSGVLTFDCDIVGQNATFASVSFTTVTVSNLTVTTSLTTPAASNVSIAGTPLDTFVINTARSALSVTTTDALPGTKFTYTPATGIFDFDFNVLYGLIDSAFGVDNTIAPGVGWQFDQTGILGFFPGNMAAGGLGTFAIDPTALEPYIRNRLSATVPALYAAATGVISFDTGTTLLTSYPLKTTTLTAGNGLTGGGDLSANRTFDLDDSHVRGLLSATAPIQYASGTGVIGFDVNTTALTQYVPITRQVIAGAGLTGGGALNTDITLNVATSGVSGFVTLTTNQSISGKKTFQNDIKIESDSTGVGSPYRLELSDINFVGTVAEFLYDAPSNQFQFIENVLGSRQTLASITNAGDITASNGLYALSTSTGLISQIGFKSTWAGGDRQSVGIGGSSGVGLGQVAVHYDSSIAEFSIELGAWDGASTNLGLARFNNRFSECWFPPHTVNSYPKLFAATQISGFQTIAFYTSKCDYPGHIIATNSVAINIDESDSWIIKIYNPGATVTTYPVVRFFTDQDNEFVETSNYTFGPKFISIIAVDSTLSGNDFFNSVVFYLQSMCRISGTSRYANDANSSTGDGNVVLNRFTINGTVQAPFGTWGEYGVILGSNLRQMNFTIHRVALEAPAFPAGSILRLASNATGYVSTYSTPPAAMYMIDLDVRD